MRWLGILALGCLVALLPLWGCGSKQEMASPVRTQQRVGDRQQDWALVYFQSWRQHRQEDYLNLSRAHMSQAVRTYFDLQVKIGHSFPDFYILDRKRRRGCRFIDEIDRLAARFRVALENKDRGGCF